MLHLKGHVLIHCYMGISRSPAIVIAYLMVACNLAFDIAYGLVRLARPQVNPISDFRTQLVNFENGIEVLSYSRNFT